MKRFCTSTGLAMLLASATALLLAGTAYAAESGSFRLYGENSNYAEFAPHESASFQMNNGGVTFVQKPAESSSFQIVSSFTASAAEGGGDTGGSGGDTGGADEGGGGGGPGGGRGARETPAPDEQQDDADGEEEPGVPAPVPVVTPRPSAPETPPEPVPPVRPAPAPAPLRAALQPVSPAAFITPALKKSIMQARQLVEQQMHAAAPVADQKLVTTQAASTASFAAPSTLKQTATVASILLALAALWTGVLGKLPSFFAYARDPLKPVKRLGIFFFPIFTMSEGKLRKKKKRSAKKGKKSPKADIYKRTYTAIQWIALIVLAGMIALLLANTAFAATTVPLKQIYNGHLLDSSGNPVTTAHSIRFSYWTSADYVAGDVTGTGAINTGASTYASWQEVHTVTPNADGFFSVELGSVTSLPDFSALPVSTLTSLHLQIEVKASAAANTAYELLDHNASSDTQDRSPVDAVPFAQNADLLDQRDTGTASGSIPVLQSGGILDTATIPGGTDANVFTLDSDDTGGNVTLQFGATLMKQFTYDSADARFEFNDDVRIEGSLSVSGLINGVDINALTDDNDTQLKVSSGGGLNINIAAGGYRISGDETQYSGSGGVDIANNATNYVFFTSTGLQLSTGGFPTDHSVIPLAEVVTQSGSVQSVTERRVMQSDDREKSIELTYHAEHQNAVYQGDATNNVGRLYVGNDAISMKNYYVWTSTLTSVQDYDVIVRVTLPEHFVRWNATPLRVSYRSTSASTANNFMDVSVFDTNGSPVSLTGSSSSLASTSWATANIGFGGSPTWTPGQDLLIKLKLSAKGDFQMHTGDMILDFVELPTQ